MKKTIALLAAILLFTVPVLAQTQADGAESFTQTYANNQMGDKYIKMQVAPTFPIGFYNQYGDPSLYVGGLLGLGFHIFLTDKLSVGADAGFGFNITVGSNVFDYIPIVASATWQFDYKKWEFPVGVGLGFAWELYNGYLYWPGLIVEAKAGALYRINSNWAVGGELNYMFMPQFSANPKQTFLGNFIVANITARYYF